MRPHVRETIVVHANIHAINVDLLKRQSALQLDFQPETQLISPLQCRNRPRPPRWSLEPPPPCYSSEYCRRPRHGTTASSLGWPSVRCWWPADRSRPHAEPEWFCLYSAPEKNLIISTSHLIFFFVDFVLKLRRGVLVSPGRWCV